jgi:hypothetical protein
LIVYFDSTFGYPLIQALKGVVWYYRPIMPALQVLHIYDRFPNDVKDEEWINAIKGSGDIIVSCDLGHGKGKKLPVICKATNTTLVLFSSALHEAKQFHKIRAIISEWPNIVSTFKYPMGARFQVMPVGVNCERFRWEEKNN